jgi:hypothetical protein
MQFVTISRCEPVDVQIYLSPGFRGLAGALKCSRKAVLQLRVPGSGVLKPVSTLTPAARM